MTTATATKRELVTGGDPDVRHPVPGEKKFVDADERDVEFIDGPDLGKVGKALVAQREELSSVKENPPRILYRWKKEGGESGGRATFGKCVKLSGLAKHFGEAEFVVWIAADHVRAAGLTRWQMEALVFHELLHVEVIEDEEGEVTYKLRAHEIEAFGDELRLYGLWRANLRMARESLQIALDFEDVGNLVAMPKRGGEEG